MAFSLVVEAWIPVLTDLGMQTRGLRGVFAPDVLVVATGDELEDAAITRLLLAIQVAADHADAAPVDWLDQHRDRFDLFHPDRPFWQNPDMVRFKDLDGALRPIISASYLHTGRGSAAVNLWHNESGLTYSPAAAARLLVVRQQFSVGGLQPFTTAAYGKHPMSAKTSVATNRPLLWLDVGRLAVSLAATAKAARAHPPGSFWFSWPEDAQPADTGVPTGVLDALTWQSRSVLIAPPSGEVVTGIMMCDGVRWPEMDGTPGYTPARELDLIPHTVYFRKQATDPYTAQGVHPDRPIWRQLATMCADPDNPARVAEPYTWLVESAPTPPRWRLAGLGSYQAGISGALSGSFPVPQRPDELAQLLEVVTAADQRIGAIAGSLNLAIGGADGYRPALPTRTWLSGGVEPIATDLAAGHTTVECAIGAVNELTDEAIEVAYRAVSRVRPGRAGTVSARKDPLRRRAINHREH